MLQARRHVQVSSLGGRIGSPGMTAYQLAKWAVGGFSQALAAEVAGASMTTRRPVPGHGALRSWRRTSQMTLIGGARPQAVCRVHGVRDLNSVMNALVVTVSWRLHMTAKGG